MIDATTDASVGEPGAGANWGARLLTSAGVGPTNSDEEICRVYLGIAPTHRYFITIFRDYASASEKIS